MGCSSSRDKGSRGDDDDDDDENECFADELPKQTYTPQANVPTEVRRLYSIKAKMGEGSFSEVVRAELKTTREPRAIKIIRKDNTKENMDAIAAELKIMQRINHPNVLRLFDVFETDTHVFAVMELATGGELFERLVQNGVFPERSAANVIKMVLEAVQYLHSIGVCHRDLKPENILYYHPGLDSKIIVADFGLAHFNETDPHGLITGTCGSPEYLAPELLSGRPYTSAVDMWSVGVITFILIGGYMPFDEPSRNELFRKISNADYKFLSPNWDMITKTAKSFVTGLLMKDAEKRMSASEALCHAWITGIDLQKRPMPPRLEMKRRKASDNLLQPQHAIAESQA